MFLLLEVMQVLQFYLFYLRFGGPCFQVSNHKCGFLLNALLFSIFMEIEI